MSQGLAVLNTVATLAIGAAALIVSIQTCNTGANEKKQDYAIDTLTRISFKLQVANDLQGLTNSALVQSLDSLGQEIKQLKAIDQKQGHEIVQLESIANTSENQFGISKASLDSLIADRKLTTKQDENALNFGLSDFYTVTNDLSSYLKPPKSDWSNLGEAFEERITSLRSLAISLASNRLVLSQRWVTLNLFALVSHIDDTRSVFSLYNHRYRDVDSIIVANFFRANFVRQYMDNSDSVYSRMYREDIGQAYMIMMRDAYDLSQKHK